MRRAPDGTAVALFDALVIGRGWFRTTTAVGLGAMALAIVAALFAGR